MWYDKELGHMAIADFERTITQIIIITYNVEKVLSTPSDEDGIETRKNRKSIRNMGK